MGQILSFEPDSSNHVRRMSYDPDSRHLHMSFKNGATATHAGVPPDVFAAMTRERSIGTYYHKVIKRHYKRVMSTSAVQDEG